MWRVCVRWLSDGEACNLVRHVPWLEARRPRPSGEGGQGFHDLFPDQPARPFDLDTPSPVTREKLDTHSQAGNLAERLSTETTGDGPK
jgi:hypothetical protein